MTNKELAVLAAKAYGIKIKWEHRKEDYWRLNRPYYTAEYSGTKEWNPLFDDSDSFWLMVKLKITVAYKDNFVMAFWPDCDSDSAIVEGLCENDPYHSVRFAILRAAAEVGRLIP